MGLMDGKKAAIFGVANDRSIAWAISEAFHAEGAELAFTFAGEILEKRVRPLAEGIGSKIILPCDVTKDEEVEKVFTTLKQEWGGLDILVHAIAFANKEDLSNPYTQTSRAGANGFSQQRESGFDPLGQARLDSAFSVFQKRDPRLRRDSERGRY